MELVAGFIVASVVVGSILGVIRQHRRPTYADDPLGEPEVDVGGIVIAMDTRVRPFIGLR